MCYPENMALVLVLALLLASCGGEPSSADGATDTIEDSPPDPAGEPPPTPAERVDAYWGAAPDPETRLLVYNEIWEALAENYAAFAVRGIDWDHSRATYQPMVEEATSYGRFFQILSHMLGAHLQDGHTWIFSQRVCFDTDLSDRPPIFRLRMHSSTLGACVTPMEDGSLLVYRVAPDNPAGLEPGDAILGYDGIAWGDLLGVIESWRLPTCGHHAASDEAESYNFMVNAVNNAHLFASLDVQRRGSAPESIPTDSLITYRNDPHGDVWSPSSGIVCSEQLPVAGVPFPWVDFSESGDPMNGDGFLSSGRVEGTNVGYIYLYSWGLQTSRDLEEAIAGLLDTDGLIIDQRYNVGGHATWDRGVSILFDADHPDVMYQAFRDLDSSDYTALDLDTPRPGYGWYSLEADEATFYDRPIAVLQGPHAASAGDIFPWLMTLHPRSRRFGLPTHGSFGGLVCWRCTEPDPHLSDLFIALTNHTDLDASLVPLQGTDQIPEQTVVLDRDDVAAGTDTVVRAALDWISE